MQSPSINYRNIAGISMKGGRRENVVFCLLEYYPESKRWFLKSLLKLKDEEKNGDEAIHDWIESSHLKHLVIDFPLSLPECQMCLLQCPGLANCPVDSVVKVNQEMEKMIKEDRDLSQKGPKTYERSRNKADEYDHTRDQFSKEARDHLLSRSFKRRLKKGYLPYWNRPIDLWIWSVYYDQLLNYFNLSYDSFGNTSLMTLSRFSFLRRHFPKDLELFEGNYHITMIELLRAKIVSERDLQLMSDLDLHLEAKMNLIKRLESKLNLFIYDNDLEMIIRSQRAFDSFILAVAGMGIHSGELHPLPEWSQPEQTRFIAPNFSLKP